MSIKRILRLTAIVIACGSVMSPVMAHAVSVSGRINAGGAVLTSPAAKKDTASYTPASVYFSRLNNTDSAKRPLALRVRTPDMTAVSSVVAAGGTGSYGISYYSSQGWNGYSYVLRIATNTASNGYAEVTASFQP